MAHTPGPWAWYVIGGKAMLLTDYGKRRVILLGEKKGGFAVCDPGGQTAILIEPKGTEPDLLLMAAAPELLAALETVLPFFEGEHGYDHPDSVLVRAAIAKAKGEGPGAVPVGGRV